MATIHKNFNVDDLHQRILNVVPMGVSVLDVGSGLAKYHELLATGRNLVTMLDAHLPYLEDRAIKFPGAAFIHSEALKELQRMGDDSFDIALAVDFIEHLEPAEAVQVINRMKRVAKTVVLFVPEGHHPQSSDGYNMGGDHWQTHRSIWNAELLEHRGFTVERWVDFHRWAADRGCDPGALWAVWCRQ